MINLFGIVRQNKEEENNEIIEETQQDFQPREKRGILKELDCLNEQELIKRENNIIKEALESIFLFIIDNIEGNNPDKNKNKNNINFRKGEDQINKFLKDRVTVQVLIKKDTKNLVIDTTVFKKAVKQPPISPSKKICNWEDDIIYDSDDENAKEFIKSLRKDLPENKKMEEEEEEKDSHNSNEMEEEEDDESNDNDYNKFFYSQQANNNNNTQQLQQQQQQQNKIIKINAKDVPCNPYLLNGMITGEEDTDNFIDLISQNDIVPYKPLPLYLPKTDPSLIFSNKNKINKTTIIDDRFPRRMTYTQSMNRQNVNDIESVIHSTPTLQFIIPESTNSEHLKKSLTRQLDVTYAKEYVNNNSFLTDAPLQCMSKIEDLSSLRNELILVEYSEPYPLVKNILGMRMNLVIWYRYPDEPSEDVKQQYYTRVLHDKERSPFLGDIEKNNPIMSLCSQLYYVPVVQKEPNSKGETVGTIRKLPDIFVAGKIEPHKIIPFIKSKEYTSIENRYNYLLILKHLYSNTFINNKVMIQSLIKSIFGDSNSLDIEKQIQDPNNPLHNLFRPISGYEYEIIQPLPSLEDCRSRITPEDVCVYKASKAYHDRVYEDTKIDLKVTQYYNIYETVCKWENDIFEKTKNLSEDQKKLFLEAFTNCSKDISDFKVGIEKLISIYSHSNALQSSVFIESHIQRKHIDKTMDLWRFPDEMFYDTIDYGYYKCYRNKDKIIQIKDTNYRSATKSTLIDKLFESNNTYDRIALQKLNKWELVNLIKDERGEKTETKVDREDEYNRRKQKLFNDYLDILKNPPDLNDDSDNNDDSQKAILNILDLSNTTTTAINDDDTIVDDDNNGNEMNDDSISISQHSVDAVSTTFTSDMSQQEVLVEFQFKFAGDGLSEVEVKFNKNQKDIKRFKNKTNQSRKSRKPKKTTMLVIGKEKVKKNISSNISYYSRNEKSEPKTRKELNEIFSDIISELKKSQKFLIAPFLRPVDTNLYPNYKTIIEHPKCIDDIDQSCVKCDYYNSDSFLSDVKLISSNAAKFNGDTAELAINSKKIVDYVETRKEIKELENRIMELREKNPKRKGPNSERGERKRRKRQDPKQDPKPDFNISLPDL